MQFREIENIEVEIEQYYSKVKELNTKKLNLIQSLLYTCKHCAARHPVSDWIYYEKWGTRYGSYADDNDHWYKISHALVCPKCYTNYIITENNQLSDYIHQIRFKNTVYHDNSPCYRQPYIYYKRHNGFDTHDCSKKFELSQIQYNL